MIQNIVNIVRTKEMVETREKDENDIKYCNFHSCSLSNCTLKIDIHAMFFISKMKNNQISIYEKENYWKAQEPQCIAKISTKKYDISECFSVNGAEQTLFWLMKSFVVFRWKKNAFFCATRFLCISWPSFVVPPFRFVCCSFIIIIKQKNYIFGCRCFSCIRMTLTLNGKCWCYRHLQSGYRS